MTNTIEYAECLKLYPEFPQQQIITHEDGSTDEGAFLFPKVHGAHWLKPEDDKEDTFLEQLINLLCQLDIAKLTFLWEIKNVWISKLSSTITGDPPFELALAYFKEIVPREKFDGGFIITKEDYVPFLQHLLILIERDGSLPYINFIDSQRRFLGHIHYRGELFLFPFTEADDKSLKQTTIFKFMQPSPYRP